MVPSSLYRLTLTAGPNCKCLRTQYREDRGFAGGIGWGDPGLNPELGGFLPQSPTEVLTQNLDQRSFAAKPRCLPNG